MAVAQRRVFADGEVQLSPLQKEFLEWLVDPATTAEKGTQKEWAEAHDLATETPSRWKRDMAFRRAWDRRLHDMNISPDRIQTVVDEVYGIITKAGAFPADKIKAATLYLQFINRLSPKDRAPAEDEQKPLEDMTDEELAEMASNVTALRAKRTG